MARALKKLFSREVAAIETRDTQIDESFLSPDQHSYVRDVSAKRRWEYVAGRQCAQIALTAVGYEGITVPSGKSGEPIWPQGIVGSITHCEGYAAAAIALNSGIVSLGLDAETNQPLSDKVLKRIGNPEEIQWVKRTKGSEYPNPGKILFSAKEATFKAWHPITGEWLGFQEAHLSFDLETRNFTVNISRPGPIHKFVGKFLINQDIILTGIETPKNFEMNGE